MLREMRAVRPRSGELFCWTPLSHRKSWNAFVPAQGASFPNKSDWRASANASVPCMKDRSGRAASIWIRRSKRSLTHRSSSHQPQRNRTAFRARTPGHTACGRGLSNREIARALDLSPHTVKNYLFRIFDKLGVSSRTSSLPHHEPLATPAPVAARGESQTFSAIIEAAEAGDPVRNFA